MMHMYVDCFVVESTYIYNIHVIYIHIYIYIIRIRYIYDAHICTISICTNTMSIHI